jgi:hypothetical protein
MHNAALAVSLTLFKDGRITDKSNAMMEMTTSNSMSVKPFFRTNPFLLKTHRSLTLPLELSPP